MSETVESVFIGVSHTEYGLVYASALQFNNVIIAHGSLLHRLYYENFSCHITPDVYKALRDELSKQQLFVENPTNVTFNFEVIGPNKNDDMQYETQEARLCSLYTHDSLKEFYVNYENMDQNANQYIEISSDFLILMIGPSKRRFVQTFFTLLRLIEKTAFNTGLEVCVESTPFNDLLFHNSLARGIISKTYGTDGEQFLMDVSLVPGVEGAPIYVFKSGKKDSIIGIVVCVLTNQEPGFSLCLNLKALLHGYINSHSQSFVPMLVYSAVRQNQKSSSPLNMELLSSAVLFVRSGHSWGSGVVVNAEHGIVLSCAHVVNNDVNNVYVVFNGERYPAKVLFTNLTDLPFDIAVLCVGNIPGLGSLIMATESPVVGEAVFAVGFPLSTESAIIENGTPTVTGGCISKISPDGGPVHVSCCIHAGLSGGALLRPPNQLLGLITSNLSTDCMIYYHYGMILSVDDFRNIIVNYIQTRDPTCLKLLTVRREDLRIKWLKLEGKL
ncbi:uncharacterized protein LOC128997122 [Macrosteles quadrilineatus]|uniref:uncharacterized protein LOC128997122 n=1 Tax=Macrosteles quadrilineatus TaxID=74068 RepID=UPI0023E2124A|nr:uncharacterized protein LOC128997122 [Macrosteles quadrilineatus]XP_054278678.1 uncharacterized protein LOC128997122 [Macrosteles quadrilineatus]